MIRHLRAIPALLLASFLILLGPGARADLPVPQPYQHPGSNLLVSVGPKRHQGSAQSADAHMTPNGRYVAFYSDAPDLVPGDTNGWGDVFVRDTVARKTSLISVAADGGPANQSSFQPSISADGRYVAFESYATNLTTETDANPYNTEIFVRDTVTNTTERITHALTGGPSNGSSMGPTISADGRYVAFFGSADDLVPNDTNLRNDVFVYDRVAGTTRLVSVAADGTQGNDGSDFPSFSADGKILAFYSLATNLVANDGNGVGDVFASDLAAGTTQRVSVASDGTEANGDSFSPGISLSADGRYVAFQSAASNLVPTDTNGTSDTLNRYDVFVRDRVAGTTERVSVTSGGAEIPRKSLAPSISADGRYVAFETLKAGQDPGSFTGAHDVFVHDRLTGATELVSATPKGHDVTGDSENPSISANGRFVAFQTDAPDFVAGDSNETMDVVRRDRGRTDGFTSLSVAHGASGWSVSGVAAFGGEVLSSATDPAGDVAGAGLDLVGASVSFQPEEAQILVRLHLASLPTASAGEQGGVAGVVYGATFMLNGEHWEVRASLSGDAPEAPSIGLYHCATVCTRTLALEGGLGTTGPGVDIGIPAADLGLSPGEQLAGLQAFTGPGDTTSGATQTIDTIALGDVTEPDQTFEAATTNGATRPDVYPLSIETFAGGFSGQLDPAVAGDGSVLWLRACVVRCGAPAHKTV